MNNAELNKLSKDEYFSEVYDWTICKEKLHNSSEIEKKLYKKEISLKLWQIWWYNVWINIWKEIWKTDPFLRPCLIINNKMWSGLVWIFPLYWWGIYLENYMYKFDDFSKYWLTKESYILLNQYKTISLKRLVTKVNDQLWLPLVTEKERKGIIDKFKNLF